MAEKRSSEMTEPEILPELLRRKSEYTLDKYVIKGQNAIEEGGRDGRLFRYNPDPS